MGVPHKHAEIIKAWADGADIEKQNRDGTWIDMNRSWPWYEDWVYRIKPQPKPDMIAYPLTATSYEGNEKLLWFVKNKLKLTFDGESGVLKKAEVL